MELLHIDNNWFLWPSHSQDDDSKIFSIIAWGEVRNEIDHPVLVVHKKAVKLIAWKDLGDTMQLIRLVPNSIIEINNNTDMSDSWIKRMYHILTWYPWYDEVTNTSYSYIPKLSGERLEEMIERFERFSQTKWISLIDKDRWWFDVTISANTTQNHHHILAEFIGLYLVFWKATLQHHELKAIKLQIPALDYSIREKIEIILERMRSHYLIINYHLDENQQVITLSSNDPDLLAYIRIVEADDADIFLTNKILELQQEILTSYSLPDSYKDLRWKLYQVKR